MDARAVSAGRLLTPLAVLVSTLAVPPGVVWIAHERKVSALLLLVGGLAAITVVPGTPGFCET